LLAASLVFLTLAGGGLLSGDLAAFAVTSTIGTVIALFIGAVSVPGLIAGIGLLQRKPWSRIVTLVVSVLNLIIIPFGTLLGAYAIWVLMQDETVRLLSGEPARTGVYA
jgi:hypothetical protein